MENPPVIYSKKNYFATDHAATMVDQHDLTYEVGPHGHEFYEIALVTTGDGVHISANGDQDLSRGDLIIVRPGAWHGYAKCKSLGVYNCCFDPQLLQRELGWLREDMLMNYLLWTGPYMHNRRGLMVVRLVDRSIEGCLENWRKLGMVQSIPRHTETLGRLLILFNCLAESVEELDFLKQQTNPLHPAVLETMRLLESQIEQDWSLKELADKNHLNPSYLVRLFKSETGLSPIAYLNHCRVERAAGLLLHTLLPIADVAAQVGWYDPNLFARRFRMAYRLSPSEYRKRFGKIENVQIAHDGASI